MEPVRINEDVGQALFQVNEGARAAFTSPPAIAGKT